MSVYGTVTNVKLLSGVQPDSIGLTTTAELETFITDRLEKASAYIREDRGRVFEDETAGVPDVIHDIAERMAANYIRAMQQQRNISMVGVEGEQNEEPRAGEPSYFTAAIRLDLLRIPASLNSRLNLFLAVDPDYDEDEDEDS